MNLNQVFVLCSLFFALCSWLFALCSKLYALCSMLFALLSFILVPGSWFLKASLYTIVNNTCNFSGKKASFGIGVA